jgi:hypothetical protein
MWQLLFEIIPKPVVLALFGYGAISWFVTGPLIAERIILQSHYPACLSDKRAEALPETMPAEEILDELQRSPLFSEPRHEIAWAGPLSRSGKAAKAGRAESGDCDADEAGRPVPLSD